VNIHWSTRKTLKAQQQLQLYDII